MSQLFRKQAVDAQGQKLKGTISLAQPLSLKITVITITIITLSTLLFLFNAHYTRKETIIGFLRPDKGIIKSYSKNLGTVKEVFVSAGQRVKAGTPLVSVMSNRALENGLDVNQKMISEVNQQIHLLKLELRDLPILEQNNRDKLTKQLILTQGSIAGTNIQKELVNKKVTLLDQQAKQLNNLYKKGFISQLDIQNHQEKQLMSLQEMEQLNSATINLKFKSAQLQNQLVLLSKEYQSKQRAIKQKLSTLNNQLLEMQSNFNYVVTASQNGTVTDIHVLPGETLSKIRPLLTILPQQSSLIAELMLPTRSAGFIAQGDTAFLRFDAFPHQKFGYIKGEVTRVDNVLITQQDVNFPININEPVYRLQAKLNKQFIEAYKKKLPLKSGMKFKADIVLENRTLFEWLIDPILNVKNKLR